LGDLGAVVPKTFTRLPREGNPEPQWFPKSYREAWDAGDHLFLNAIGLTNPGIEAAMREVTPNWDAWNATCILSFSSDTVAQFGEMAAMAMKPQGIVLSPGPGDPALLVVPMLCHHRLQPGEAVFVGPGVPHLYLSGLAVEVMPPGDNVLRGGLTAKRVDVPALVEALDPTAGAPPVQRATSDVHRYDVPGDDFGVCRLTDTGIDVEDRIGPDLVLGMAGSTTVGDDLVIGPGEAAVVPEADGPYRLATDGLAYLVTVGAA